MPGNPLYQRVRTKHPDQPAIAVGHAMGKLLHIGPRRLDHRQPVDPAHYSGDKRAPGCAQAGDEGGS
jgi:hypothetical protein